MMKYRVEKNFCSKKIGEIIDSSKYTSFACVKDICISFKEAVEVGILSIVEEPRTLQQKFESFIYRESDGRNEHLSPDLARYYSDIARQHFVEVAERANKEWGESFKGTKGTNQDYIINAIKESK